MRARNVGNRPPKDLDTFSDQDCVGEDRFWDERFEDWLPEGTNRVATVDELYTIKVSHSFWELPNGSWNKHVFDMVTLQDAGGQLDFELYKVLKSVWTDLHGKKKMDLTKQKEGFFKDAVVRKYDHDSLHLSMAYGDRPIYESVVKDGHTVDIDPAKQWALPHDELVKMLREEIYVTALERLVIPSDYRYSPGKAYWWALRRCLTSLFKNRTARFVAENFKEFRNADIDYVGLHKSKCHLLIPLET